MLYIYLYTHSWNWSSIFCWFKCGITSKLNAMKRFDFYDKFLFAILISIFVSDVMNVYLQLNWMLKWMWFYVKERWYCIISMYDSYFHTHITEVKKESKISNSNVASFDIQRMAREKNSQHNEKHTKRSWFISGGDGDECVCGLLEFLTLTWTNCELCIFFGSLHFSIISDFSVNHK